MHLQGFGNYHQTEAIVNALPKEQNSPQACALGLYAEQLSGSAFTRPRHVNFRSWLYRTRPSVSQNQGDYSLYKSCNITVDHSVAPNPLRWSPLATPKTKIDFVDGL